MATDSRFGYVFPAIRGIQAGREYYVSMCPLRLISKLFLYDEDEAELPPELRAQRTLNKARIPEIARYIVTNREDYVFSAITASVDGDVQFDPIGDDPESSSIGMLRIPMEARFIIDDGQHRRAAIERAVHEEPKIGDDSIAVVFFHDRGLVRCQQMFADLNRYAVRPSKSLGVLYDHRDDFAQVVRLAVLRSDFLNGLVEMERSSLSLRSRKLFTLSALYSATSKLLEGLNFDGSDDAAVVAAEYWEEVARHTPEWLQVRERKMSAGEVRSGFIHSHGTVLQALGTVGNYVLHHQPQDWKARMVPLKGMDWSRSNSDLWEGRAMEGGRISRSNRNVTLTASAIKEFLGLALTEDERREEDLFRRRHDAGE